MIQTYDELKEYLICDKRALGIKRKVPRPFTDEIWKYEICLRIYEFFLNKKQSFIIYKFLKVLSKFILHYWSVKLGIYIGPNTCDKGLCITHPGCIQINWHAKIGKNLRIQEGVTIGGGRGGAPTVGNNVYLGSGCKVIGGITVADDCVVGANAVVCRDILEKHITVAGVPAKKISDNGSDEYIRKSKDI